MLHHINQLKTISQRVKIQGIAATEKIADLMGIAEVLITKPGGCTTNEALVKKLPMIFHAPFALMAWEVFNMKFCIKIGMGARFKLAYRSLFKTSSKRNKDKLLPVLKEAFERKQIFKSVPIPFDMKDFKDEFIELINTLLYKT
jgi:processive 1,2-diacylglycerol beta-glucosyltransferase